MNYLGLCRLCCLLLLSRKARCGMLSRVCSVFLLASGSSRASNRRTGSTRWRGFLFVSIPSHQDKTFNFSFYYYFYPQDRLNLHQAVTILATWQFESAQFYPHSSTPSHARRIRNVCRVVAQADRRVGSKPAWVRALPWNDGTAAPAAAASSAASPAKPAEPQQQQPKPPQAIAQIHNQPLFLKLHRN